MIGADASRESTGRRNHIRQIISVVPALNLTVAEAKLDYGFVSGSVAMYDAGVHSLLDGLANVVGIGGIAVAARPPDLVGERSGLRAPMPPYPWWSPPW